MVQTAQRQIDIQVFEKVDGVEISDQGLEILERLPCTKTFFTTQR